jgi:membrane protease subunit HflC
MSRTTILFLVLFLVAVIVLPQTFYTVDETQHAIVTRFGDPKRQISLPGIYSKTPFVESVVKVEKRLLRVDVPPSSLLTSDRRNLIIDAYARYRIVDPLRFRETLTSELAADSRVGNNVASELRREVALDLQSDVISESRQVIMQRVTLASNRDRIERTEVLNLPQGFDTPALTIEVAEVVGGVTQRGRAPTPEERQAIIQNPSDPILQNKTVLYLMPLSNRWGIEVVDVRLKRADFPAEVAVSVYDRMRAERERIASGLRAEGRQADLEIRAEVDREVQVILETARGTADRVRGEAEEQAIQILASALNRDPELYDFLRTLDTYRATLGEGDTLVLDANSDLFKFLQGPTPQAAP